ncbi:MAG TPA: isoprenylcysteine carboxylmethyltransferase family protein [Balneolales bacterium]|nr:isoprenylcysteine carboxylmethyltransferase family protein [Balneolales bacterium]
MSKNFLSLIAFLIAAFSLVLLVYRHHLVATSPLFIGIQIAAVLLMIWSRLTFGLRSFHASASTSEGKLVTKGPYHYLRHPIYASIIYFTWAGQIQSPTFLSLGLAIIATVALLVRMILEEEFLREKYPEYTQYMRDTKRIIPFVV